MHRERQKMLSLLFIIPAVFAMLSPSTAAIHSATSVHPDWEANPQRYPISDMVFQYSRLVDVLDYVLAESGVRHAMCVASESWPREIVGRFETGGKDLRSILEELSKGYPFAYQWGPDFLLVGPDAVPVEVFRSQLDVVTTAPIIEATGLIGSGTVAVGSGLNARVFRITDDVGIDPASVYRRLEVIRGVGEFLKILLYENCESDPGNPQRRVIYPESRDEELRDSRFLGTITVIDTPENLRKVADFLESARRSVDEFRRNYWQWSAGRGERPQRRTDLETGGQSEEQPGESEPRLESGTAGGE